MEFSYNYSGDSSVRNTAEQTAMSFAPDTLREPTYFRGELSRKIPFREAISALHDVVVSDLRFKPKDRTEYLAWRASQEDVELAQVAAQQQTVAAQVDAMQTELSDLRRASRQRMGPYESAKRKYFEFLYRTNRDYWFVLDPVITVHPDEVFFECFSQDESSYGRLGASYEVFENIGEFACGTTNIDYSSALYDEFQKIRSYKTTQLEVDPSGFEMTTTREAAYKEVKIDLPDSWVRGFLQVSSAMSLPSVQFELHPLDIFNLCQVLRRKKEKKGPRGMRYLLSPGKPVRVLLEPWNLEIECPRSRYTGDFEGDVRVWGRRRIHILERLIPLARRFRVFLLGKGMPSFYVADLGEMSFSLGLSGWTANDWSSAGNFDLLAPRAEVDQPTKERVFEALKAQWLATPEELAGKLGLDRSVVLGALAAYTQAGRAIWDIEKQVYRARELSREPLPMEQLRFTNDREQAAARFVEAQAVSANAQAAGEFATLTGHVRVGNRRENPVLRIDRDERIVDAQCTCNFHQQNQLRMGPCEHILAVRLFWNRQSRI